MRKRWRALLQVLRGKPLMYRFTVVGDVELVGYSGYVLENTFVQQVDHDVETMYINSGLATMLEQTNEGWIWSANNKREWDDDENTDTS